MKKFTLIFFTLIFIMNLCELHTQDWPNLNKYKSPNEKLKSSKNKENRMLNYRALLEKTNFSNNS